METEPAEAVQDLRQGGRAVPDETLLFQFGAAAGGNVSLGGRDFEIAGALRKVPGDASASASFAPRVYIALQDLPLDLLRPGSVAHYRAYVKFREGTDVAQKIAALTPQIRRLGLEFETVDKRKKDLGASVENLYRFLNLVGFISLLLGAVGIASAIQAHLQQKARTGAILRCLGTSTSGVAFIYFIQASEISLAGALFGGLVRFGLCRRTWRRRCHLCGSRAAADCVATPPVSAELELRPPAGTGKSVPPEQPNSSSHCFPRSRNLFAAHNPSHARRCDDAIPVNRSE